MPINFSDAAEQREFGVLPDGSFVKLKLNIRHGGITVPGMEPADNGLFTKSRTSDVHFLDCEFKVLVGRHKGAGVYRAMTVTGGDVDENGVSRAWNVSKSQIRAIIESALGIDPNDSTPAANAKRTVPAFSALHGLEFAARTGIEQGTDGYNDKTVLAHIVLPGEDEYPLVMAGRGDECPLKPSGIRRPRGAAAARPAQAPAWSGAPQQPGAAWTQPAPVAQPQPNAPAAPATHLPSWVTAKN